MTQETKAAKVGRKGAGWVYAAREVGTPLVKIGYTHKTPQQRVMALRHQFHTQFVLVAAVWVSRAAYFMEQFIHEALKPQRIEKEFFYCHMNQAIFESIIDDVVQTLGLGSTWSPPRPDIWVHGASRSVKLLPKGALPRLQGELKQLASRYNLPVDTLCRLATIDVEQAQKPVEGAIERRAWAWKGIESLP